jgi:hypothetical protein
MSDIRNTGDDTRDGAPRTANERRLVEKNEQEAARAADTRSPLGPSPRAASTPIQSTYPDTIRPGVEGAIVNEEPVRLISRTVEDAAGIPFGRGVIQGVANKGCKLGAMGTEGNMLGVTVRERSVKAEFPNGFMQYDSARIMRSGVIWVAVTEAVLAGDPAKISATGTWGKGTGTGDVPHARYDTSQATVGGLAQLRIDG